MIEIQWINRDFVLRALQNIQYMLPELTSKEAERVAKASVKKAQNYPPAPFGSTYIRTYEFKNAWEVSQYGAYGYEIYNDANQFGSLYPVYVMGNDLGQGQAGVHSGNWELIRDVVDYEIEDTLSAFESDIRNVVKSEGL
jgi:hypothetical protein